MMNNTTILEHGINGITEQPRHLTRLQQLIITICYLLGIFGNLLALILLCRKGYRSSNQKHNLILKCLSVNDLTALLGMLILMYIQLYLPAANESIWQCRARVVWRVFGLGSGCVAIVMAIERWLALTKPFFYQKYVTLVLLRRCIFGLWSFALILVCMPFIGFGLYYEPNRKKHKCVSYRDAKSPLDVAYAYIYFIIGMSLCLGIVSCNIAVMKTLCFKNYTYQNNNAIRIKEPVLMRRISRSFSKMSTMSTREELAFGRLMGILCVLIVACWLPQLLTIPLHLMRQQEKSDFYRIPEMLLTLHFLLDPYVYVLQRSSAFRRLFCSTRNNYSQYRPSVRVVTSDHIQHLTKDGH